MHLFCKIIMAFCNPGLIKSTDLGIMHIIKRLVKAGLFYFYICFFKFIHYILKTDILNAMIKKVLILLLLFSSVYSQNPQWIVYTMQNSQLPSNVTGIIVVDSNNIKWIGTTNGIVRINGNVWTIFDSTNSPISNDAIPWAKDAQNKIWISTNGKGVIVFDNGNWIILNTTNSGIPTNYIRNIEIDPINDTKWFSTNIGAVKYDGTNWITYDTTNSQIPHNNIAVIKSRNDTVWIGTTFKGLARFCNNIWTKYNIQNSNIPGNIITGIEIDKGHLKWIATYLGNGLGKLNDSSNSWAIYNTTNSGLPMNNLQCVKVINGIKWIGTAGQGIAKYNDTMWIVFNQQNSPIPSGDIHDITIDKLGNEWMTCAGGLVIYNETGIIGINNQQTEIPIDFELSQNYPNPFNPTTKITYNIPRDAKVKLIIYDILGREIKRLINDELKLAGSYTIEFNGTNLSSGVYFYKLESSDYSESKKMVLIK